MQGSDLKNQVVIIVPGLFSDCNGSLYVQATKFLVTRGYDVICFAYNLLISQGVPLSRIAEKLNKQINQLSSERQVALCAHSLGAYLALLAKTGEINKFMFWEPSLHPKEIFAYANYNLPPNFLREVETLPEINSLLKDIKKPVKIITAEKSGKKVGEWYFQHTPEPKEYVCIPNATHTFAEKSSLEPLLNYTMTWLEKS